MMWTINKIWNWFSSAWANRDKEPTQKLPYQPRTHYTPIFNNMIRNNNRGQQMLFVFEKLWIHIFEFYIKITLKKSLNGTYRSKTKKKYRLNRAYAEYLWATLYMKCGFYLLRWIWFIRRTYARRWKRGKILNELWNLASKQSFWFFFE